MQTQKACKWLTGPSILVRFSIATRQPAQLQSYTTEMSPEISLTVRVNVFYDI